MEIIPAHQERCFPSCLVRDVGCISVRDAEHLMLEEVEIRQRSDVPDLLLFLSHPRTVAVGAKDGRATKPKDLLVDITTLYKYGIDFVRSMRGGGITYHWPGQVVCYPVVKLGPSERDVTGFMKRLEQVAVETLRLFDISGYVHHASPAHVGIWHAGRKIVSMGVRISRWVTSFGFAINVGGDIGPSSFIRPCGIEGARLITMEQVLGRAPDTHLVHDAVTRVFSSVFQRRPTAEPVPFTHSIEYRPIMSAQT